VSFFVIQAGIDGSGIGIADQQKAGKQGRDDSTKLFSIQVQHT